MCHQDLELRPGPPCCTILDSSWPTLKVTPHTGTKQKCATITSKLWGRGGIHRQLLATYLKPITGLGSYVMVLVVCLCCGRGRRLRNCTENVGRAERGAERGSSLSAEINVPFCPIFCSRAPSLAKCPEVLSSSAPRAEMQNVDVNVADGKEGISMGCC